MRSLTTPSPELPIQRVPSTSGLAYGVVSSRLIRMQTPAAFLDRHLVASVPKDSTTWVSQAISDASTDAKPWIVAFAMATRRLGQLNWTLSEDDIREAQSLREGWQPQYGTVADAFRIRLLLALPETVLIKRLAEVFATADLGEQIACYRGLPLYAHPAAHQARAAEGVRSNVQDIFCAVAHHNPYPCEQLDDGAWNQMVLKALFVGVPLAPIYGLDARANPGLSRMLSDYARERRVASRAVSHELWRGVGPHADEASRQLLATVLAESNSEAADAAALALASCQHPEAATLLAADPAREQAISSGQLTWSSIS